MLPRLFAAFHALHPRIQLVLSIDNRMLDLGRREADVALRVQRPVDASLFGRRLTSIAWAFYGPRDGVGIALLPCYLADREPEARRICAVLPELASELWIVTHKDLKHTARIRAFRSVAGDAIAAAHRSFEGTG